MTRSQLKAFCNLLMCSDPTPVSAEDNATLTAFADAEARRHGFDDWIVAFHELTPGDETPAKFLVSWTGGYEPAQYAVHSTEAEAWTQAHDWAEDAKHGDSIDVFRIDLDTNVIERLELPKEE